MADIFLSYSRSDLARARQFEQALEACGWSVFWDRELLPGEGFRHAIENELRQARCVIVLWSKTSIESEWVIDEAESGKQNGRLVSVRIDDIEMPLGLRQLQAANLMDWRGDGEHPEFQLLTRRLRALNPSRLAVGHGEVLERPLEAIDRAIAETERKLASSHATVAE